jgi:hypothetical protein
MLCRVSEAAYAAVTRFRRVLVGCLAAALVVIGHAQAFATDPPPLELPDTGVDVPALIELAGVEVGGYIQAAMVLMVAILCITIAIKWIRRGVRG